MHSRYFGLFRISITCIISLLCSAKNITFDGAKWYTRTAHSISATRSTHTAFKNLVSTRCTTTHALLMSPSFSISIPIGMNAKKYCASTFQILSRSQYERIYSSISNSHQHDRHSKVTLPSFSVLPNTLMLKVYGSKDPSIPPGFQLPSKPSYTCRSEIEALLLYQLYSPPQLLRAARVPPQPWPQVQPHPA